MRKEVLYRIKFMKLYKISSQDPTVLANWKISYMVDICML